MKLKKVIIGSTLAATILGGLGAQTVQAAEYPSATEAKSEGKVTFTEGGPEIVDPTDPDIPIAPVDPTDPTNPTKPINPGKADLMIQYVSDFDFGTHSNSLKALKANAKPDYAFALDAQGNRTGDLYAVPSFVSTKDVRAERTGWELTVTASKFTSSKGTELKGAEVTLKDLTYNTPTNPIGTAPTAATGNKILTPATETTVATAGDNSGIGSWSLGMGALSTDEKAVQGVELNIPQNSLKENDTYKATFDWELKADPTVAP
ncbi:hypothetical protein UAY_00090 [Enterococcus moraviensis ATCC BAA-383]|uniref:WxL domain-containing protein n=1 Tax=Enterococcus moraviensis ATCC BAA-383 TaxID=1158609 RepID=R2THT7_9ENTE|nr:WxL domain-containing protein [Enterococcus moraviensis]EOI06748.1 hypothetical protein UAY_00090 [Enterococcus moraviensis ATCC BAA-383]EOT65085.1 hypothetical protein I586_02819 [Enterococcus moraviensis ATCC BAA-383]OJG66932.1 hypothetical protein RV09_GL003149 [Enterococcus moraviensis]